MHTLRTLISKSWRALLLVAIIVAVSGLGYNTRFSSAASATAQLQLSPTSTTVTTGSSVVVSVVVNTAGNSINDVQSVLTYPASLLSYASIVPGPAFSATAPVISSGSIEFGDSAPAGTAVTGTQTVATITFTATNTGSAALSLATVCPAGNYALTCSAVYDSTTSDNDLANVANATYTISAPATPPPSGSGSTSGGSTSSGGTSRGSSSSSGNKSSSGGSSSSSGTSRSGGLTGSSTSGGSSSAGSTAAPTVPGGAAISNIKATNVTATSAVITWQTDTPATSVVNYGATPTEGLTAQDGSLVTSHSVTLNSPLLAGTTYYYTISSVTAGGIGESSTLKHFNTVGFAIVLQILDKNGKPISNATVTIDGQTAISQANGDVTFQNIPAGDQSLVIKSGHKTTTAKVSVGKIDPKTGTYQLQHFSLTATRGPTYTWAYVLVLIVLVVGLVPTLGRPFLTRAVERLHGRRNPPGGPSPTIGDGGHLEPALQAQSTPAPSAEPPAVATPGMVPPPGADLENHLKHLHGPKLPDPGTLVSPSDENKRA